MAAVLTPGRMTRHRFTIAAAAAYIMSVSGCAGQTSEEPVSREYRYSPAFADRQLLRTFPLNGAEHDMRLPATLTAMTYSPDGRSMYGFDSPRSGLLKIEFNRMLVREVPGSQDLRGAFGVAVSADEERFILSGTYPVGGARSCGLFEFRQRTKDLRMLVENPDCGPRKETMAAALATWAQLNLSPDGEKAVAHNRAGLVMIDLVRHTIEPTSGAPFLGTFAEGAWSPDGKWLALVEQQGKRRTILFNAKTLKQERTFEAPAQTWSPDSRYLLGVEEDRTCGPYWATFRIIDAVSGKLISVGSSKCKVNLGGIGWVRKD